MKSELADELSVDVDDRMYMMSRPPKQVLAMVLHRSHASRSNRQTRSVI